MKRRTRVFSILLHALLLVIAYIFQGMIFPYLRLMGLTPMILPLVSTGVAIYEGRDAGGVMGLFAGIFCDVAINEPVGAFTVLLTITGLVVGTMADTLITRKFVTYLLCCFAVLALSALMQMLPLALLRGIPVQALLSTAIRQTLYSLLFTLPVWVFVRALGKRAQRVSPSGRPL